MPKGPRVRQDRRVRWGPQARRDRQARPVQRVLAGVAKIVITQVTDSFSLAAVVNDTNLARSHARPARSSGAASVRVAYGAIITDSRPSGPNAWIVFAKNTLAAPATVTIYALCMTTDPSAVIARASNFTPAKKHK